MPVENKIGHFSKTVTAWNKYADEDEGSPSPIVCNPVETAGQPVP